MQVEYQKKLPRPKWDPVKVEYPVRRFPDTGVSSETIGRRWIPPPETIRDLRHPVDAIKDYMQDYNTTKELARSQTSLDFGFKHPETKRFNKHTSSTENHYIYPPSRRLADRPPQCRVHGTTEMRDSYTVPTVPARLVTNKDQFKTPESLGVDMPIEPVVYKELEPLDTTHEGFEKYLDPYLTTSRLHHRPYTEDQLSRPSVKKDVVTYYTCADGPWVRSRKPDTSEWRLLNLRPKTSGDREKFKQDFREIRTHNKLNWVPGAFRTEVRDNFRPQTSQAQPRFRELEEEVKTLYEHFRANLPTNIPEEDSTIRETYRSMNSHVGSGKPMCSILNQLVEKNKRLARKSTRTA